MSIQSSKVRERILSAATELLAAQGIRATGIDCIVRSANASKMSLYKYFPSKEALIVACLEKYDAGLWSWFVEQVERKAPTPKDQLLAIFEVHAGWLTRPDFQGCPLINAAAEFPDQSHPVHQASAAFYRRLQHHMTDLSARAGARFPERLAGQLRALFEGAIVSEQLQRNSGVAVDARSAAEILIVSSIE